MNTITNWNPQWTTEVKIEGGGRYPLGLNRFHDHMEEILIKSITWLASRLRHFSYSCWALGDIELSGQSSTWPDFVQAFQRRETALLTGLHLMEPDYSVPGSTRISARCSGGAETCDCSYSVMASNDLGAFGLYYAGGAYNFGFTEYDASGAIILTPEGKRLYRLVEQRPEITGSDYYRHYRGKSEVPTDTLMAWGHTNDYDNLHGPDCRAERDFFKSLIFRLDQQTADDYRRESFAFFLHCIDLCTTTGATFSEDVLRNIHYYASYFDDAGAIREFTVPAQFNDSHFYWSIYEGQDYFRDWLSAYFQVFLEYLKAHSDGATLDEFFDALDSAEFNETIAYFVETEADWLDKSLGELIGQFGGPAQLADPFSEEIVTLDEDYLTSAGMLAKFILTMAGLWSKFQPLRRDRRYQFIALNLGGDLWFDVLFQTPGLQKMSLRDFLRKMLKTYILDQHDRIMMEKNDLRRCWFTTEKNRYFFQADVNVLGRPAKYGTIMTYLTDMNLIELTDQGQHQLTEEGQKFYGKLEEDYFHDG